MLTSGMMITGSVVASGDSAAATPHSQSGDLTPTHSGSTASHASGATANPSETQTTASTTPQKPAKAHPVTMLEAIKWVIDANKIPLSRKTNVSFQNLSSADKDYAYAKTAQEKSMIGKNANLAQQISCDTYMVFKGLAEGWKMPAYTDVKTAYWNKAQEL